MSYQFIPNILFLLAVLAVIVLVLRRLPEIKNSRQAKSELPVAEKLVNKGLPALAISRLKSQSRFYLKKIWQFMLEAKGLKPHGLAGYKIKKIFTNHRGLSEPNKPATLESFEEAPGEDYFLEQIKLQPRNLEHYDSLGKFYLDENNFAEAKDIYSYLISHEPNSGNYHARLAYCFFQLKDFEKSAKHYQTSLSLDSAQPNRYYNLGLSLAALGNFAEAVKNYEQAISLETENPNYFLALAKAKEAWAKAEGLDTKTGSDNKT